MIVQKLSNTTGINNGSHAHSPIIQFCFPPATLEHQHHRHHYPLGQRSQSRPTMTALPPFKLSHRSGILSLSSHHGSSLQCLCITDPATNSMVIMVHPRASPQDTDPATSLFQAMTKSLRLRCEDDDPTKVGPKARVVKLRFTNKVEQDAVKSRLGEISQICHDLRQHRWPLFVGSILGENVDDEIKDYADRIRQWREEHGPDKFTGKRLEALESRLRSSVPVNTAR